MKFSETVAIKSYQQEPGGGEHFIVVEPPYGLSVEGQIAYVEKRYDEAQRELGLPNGSAIFRRLFVSDIVNQRELLQRSALFADKDGSPVAISLVEQRPLSQAKLSLLAYHVSDPLGVSKRMLTPRHIIVEKRGLSHLWTTGLCASVNERPSPVSQQTREVFRDVVGTLDCLGGTLLNNCVRTWIYVKDVDVFYNEMVTSRRELFLQEGLSAETHFIASTGIEGACAHRFDMVSMDAYSILGLLPEQISYLNDFNYLCPANDYNVTFERGTRISYSDRAHLYLSGTASIDNVGQVVHVGDVSRQFDRAIENFCALLKAGLATLDDVMYVIVYLRDPADYSKIRLTLAERLPGIPAVVVKGRVCRPEWLVEIEGVAIAENRNEAFPRF